MIYFLIVNYYSTNYVEKLINSLIQCHNPLANSPHHNNSKYLNQPGYQVIIVNNSPDDPSIYKLSNQLSNQSNPESVLILDADTNLGFGGGCNLGLKYIYERDQKALVWMINPDTFVQANVVDLARDFFQSHSDVSILGTMTLTTNQEIWFAGGVFNADTGAIAAKNILENTDTSECDWVSGCSLVVNLQKFSECPLFDPAYFLYYEDFDFCRRYGLAGHKICITKQIIVYHAPSSITNQYIFRKIKNSTYGYLLALTRYSNQLVFYLRLLRVILHALLILPVRSQTAFGKIAGIFMFFKNNYFQ